jgi:predicted ATPase
MALTMGCRQAWLLRDARLVEQRATELIALSEEQGFPYWLARGRCYAGWVAIGQGRVEDGLALLEDAVSHLAGSDVAMGNIAGLIGDAYARAGHLAAALRYIDDALRVAARTGEVWSDAEHHRLKGVVLATGALGDSAAAETHFLRAIDIARSQAAKLWELRAAISLARLWSTQRKSGDALKLLAEVRGAVPDGGNAPDLAEADLLLTELTRGASQAQPDIQPVGAHQDARLGG